MVANVGELVAQHTRQLVIVEPLSKSCGDRYGVTVLVDATGKGVQLVVLDNVDFWHFHSAGHAEILHDVVDARIFLALQRPGPNSMPDHGCIREIGNDKPQPHPTNDPGQRLQEIIVHLHHVQLVDIVARIVVVAVAKEAQHGKEHPHHAKNNHREENQQQDALQVVATDLCLNAYVLHETELLELDFGSLVEVGTLLG